MTSQFCSRIRLIFAVTIVAFTCATASTSIARPVPFLDEGYNSQWKCSKTVGILTVCTKNR